MKIFVTGATGALGSRVLRLLAPSHEVTALARTADKSDLVRALGAAPTTLDLFDADAVAQALRGFDAVLNLATHIPSLAQMSRPRAWSENTKLRTVGAANVARAAQAGGVRRLVQESIAMTYQDGGARWLTETSPLETSSAPAPAQLAAETAAAQFGAGGGEAVILRFCLFYGPGASHTVSQLALARRGVAPFLGPPDAYQTYLHLDDAATAVAAALVAPPGTYNVGEREPQTVRERTATLARVLGRRLHRVPLPARAVGRANGYLFNSLRVSSDAFTTASGWSPAYPTPALGWAQVVGS